MQTGCRAGYRPCRRERRRPSQASTSSPFKIHLSTRADWLHIAQDADIAGVHVTRVHSDRPEQQRRQFVAANGIGTKQ